MIPCWEHFEHEADIGIRGIAPSPEHAFEQIAVAMSAVITNPDHVTASESVDISCEAPDLELLLLDWINNLIYEMAVRGILKAQAFGEVIDRQKHQPAVEIKGATFTELRVYQKSAKVWIAQCVVDV